MACLNVSSHHLDLILLLWALVGILWIFHVPFWTGGECWKISKRDSMGTKAIKVAVGGCHHLISVVTTKYQPKPSWLTLPQHSPPLRMLIRELKEESGDRNWNRDHRRILLTLLCHRLPSLYNIEPPAHGKNCKKKKNYPALLPMWQRQFLNWCSLFPSVSSLVQVCKNQHNFSAPKTKFPKFLPAPLPREGAENNAGFFLYKGQKHFPSSLED